MADLQLLLARLTLDNLIEFLFGESVKFLGLENVYTDAKHLWKHTIMGSLELEVYYSFPVGICLFAIGNLEHITILPNTSKTLVSKGPLTLLEKPKARGSSPLHHSARQMT